MEEEDEEISDDFSENTALPDSTPNPFVNPDDPNKPKPLLEQYHERRVAEEAVDQKEREYYESRIRAIVSANPKIDIGKPSALQEKMAEMSLTQLKYALQSAE